MPIHERYELLELLSELKQDLCIAGRDRNTDLPVIIHFLNSGNVDQDNAVLRATLAPEFKKHLIEVGHNHGTPYVITDYLPAGMSVRTWVADGTPASALTLAERTDQRVTEPVRPMQLPPESEHADIAASQTGTFTRFLRAKAGNNVPDPRVDEPAVADALPQETSIAAAASPPELLPVSAAAEDRTVDLSRRVPGTPETDLAPGEFTRFIQSGNERPVLGRQTDPVPPKQAPSSLGDISEIRPASPAREADPPAPSPETSEFTRNSRSAPVDPPRPAKPAITPLPWEFLSPAAPPESRNVPDLPEAGAFPWFEQTAAGNSAEATKVFTSGRADAKGGKGHEQGSGEYTRMSRAGSVDAKQDAPKAVKPTLASKTGFQFWLPLILILSALLMIAIVVTIIIVAKTRPSG